MWTDPQESRLLYEIERVPDDTQRRLIYVDWLDEHGDPKVEFVRCEIEVEACAAAGSRKRLVRAVDELIRSGKRFDTDWKRRLMRYRSSEILVALSPLDSRRRR